MNDKIAQTAYYKWELAGKPQGRQEEFWLEAEREVQADQRLNNLVHALWKTTTDRHKEKINSIWQRVKNLIQVRV